jgi:hypothetical protein
MAKGNELGQSESIVHIDPLGAQYFKGRMPEMNFGIVMPTPRNVYKALHEGDRQEVFPRGHPDLETTRGLLREHFAWYEAEGFPIRSTECIVLDKTTSSGFPFGAKKGETIKLYDPYLRWYTQLGNRDRPMPIWTANPKTEYLDMEKIEDLKIRIFRNPPLDYLLLEKRYFEAQDEALLRFNRRTWSALGFVKEKGGWSSMVSELRWKHHKPGVKRQFYKWDVKFWDKGYGPELDWEVDNVRLNWFVEDLTAEHLEDIRWLRDEGGFSYEILPNGEVIATSLAQKSGKLRTSTNNTVGHIFILCFHYVRMCRKMGVEPTHKHMMRVMVNYIYSDDMQGATDYPEYVQEKDLAETYAMFGMGVKEYEISDDPRNIHFLGCSNTVFKGKWVPKYNVERMIFALVYVGGRLSDTERTSRVVGLAHNLAFDEAGADLVVDYAHWLKEKGRWVGAPMITKGDLRVAFTAGSRGEEGPRKTSNVVLHCRLPTRTLHPELDEKEKDKLSKTRELIMKRSTRKTSLENLVQEKVIERDSKAWLTTVMDPFHDNAIELSGMPDTNLGKSVIQCVPYSQAIKCPAGLAAANWDCHVVMWPLPKQIMPTQAMAGLAANTNYSPGGWVYPRSGMNLFPVGGVTAYSVASGGDTYGDTAASSVTTDCTLSLEDGYLDGCARVIGCGFEVVNTTAPLYKQGQVAVYQQPTPTPQDTHAALYMHTSSTLSPEEMKEGCKCGVEDGKLCAEVREKRRKSLELETCPVHDKVSGKGPEDPMAAALYAQALGHVDTWLTPTPPKNLAATTKLAGTAMWEAEAGVYVPLQMNTTLNPAKTQLPCTAMVINADTQRNGYTALGLAPSVYEVAATDVIGPAKAGAAGNVQPILASGTHISPFNIGGAYFTGLSPQTTLQINVKWFIERFPTPYENDLVVLARPSSPFDPRALELYGLAMNKLPVGVKQGENPLGEWFSDVLDKVADVAAPMGHALSMVPGIGAPAALIGNVADAYKTFRGKPAPKKKVPKTVGGQVENRPKKALSSSKIGNKSSKKS